MSDYDAPLPADPDREVTDTLDLPDPEAPADDPQVHPPREDADRPVPPLDEGEDALQEENAGTSLDQPSDQSS